MKYIITESQYQLLIETSSIIRIKRRTNKETMKGFITQGEINYPMLCDDFNDEFEYADYVISYAVDEFMAMDDFITNDDDIFSDEKYDEIVSILTNMCRDWFGEYLFEIYRETCSENDINEAYTPWVKRRLKMVRNAERETSNYMTHKFKQNPQQYRKNQFIDVFFSIMMDELHGDLSNWGTEDFDYENVQQQLKDSFRDYVEELWKQLSK